MDAPYFEDFETGQEYRTRLSDPVTNEMIDTYLELTGDRFPIHADRAFAQSHGLEDRMVPGNFVSALAAGLLYDCGHLRNLKVQSSKKIIFVSPLFPDQRFYVVDTVAQVADRPDEPYGKVAIDRQIFSEKDTLIQRVENSYRILKRPTSG